MEYRHLRVERTSPAIATVTLDRPAKANALHYEHLAEIEAAAQMIKQSVNQIAGALDAAIMHMDADQNLLAAGSDERRSAIESYLAKTTPTFTGN